MSDEDEFYKVAFTDNITEELHNVPKALKRAVIRICNQYNIMGICDPMYIANVIAKELSLGDGKSNFWEEK